MTYDREQNVIAWHSHYIGGTFDGGPAVVEGVAVIPNPAANSDDVWIQVKRTINNDPVRYVEYIEDFFEADDDIAVEDAFFVDSGLTFDAWNTDAAKTLTLTASTYGNGSSGTLTATGHTPFVSGDVGKSYRLRLKSWDDVNKTYTHETAQALITAYTSSTAVSVALTGDCPSGLQAVATDMWAELATSFTGADHLEGETVSVLVDGATVPDVTVYSGGFSLDVPAAVVHVGFNSAARLQSLPMVIEQPPGSSRKALRSIDRIGIDFLETVGATYGVEASDLDRVPFKKAGQPMDTAVPLFTGVKDLGIRNKHSRDPAVWVVQDLPLPCHVRAILPTLEVHS